GLCMHTILRDGNRLHLGISTGGHYLSEDGGQTFTAANQGVGAGFTPDPYPEFGQCVHKIASHPAAPGRLYMQNHRGWSQWSGPGGPRPDIGVLRSDDHGKTWRSIAKGLPSDLGVTTGLTSASLPYPAIEPFVFLGDVEDPEGLPVTVEI